MKFLIIISMIVNFLFMSAGFAENSRQIEKPQNPDKVEFYLLTIEEGEELYMRYGHTMIQLHNLENGNVYNFNWGLFDFTTENFGWKFFKGVLQYHLGVSSTSNVVRMYRDWEKRKVWKDKINLTTEQKHKLIDKIFENLKPENRGYSYQHFYNNCSTKPRDLLNDVTNNYIELIYTQSPSSKDFRQYVVENLNSPMYSGFFLSILMNRLIDIDITKWEEMFYPPKLREYLLEMPAIDDQGQPTNEQKFLSDSEVFIDGPSYPASTFNLYYLIYGVGIILVLISGIGIVKFNPQTTIYQLAIKIKGVLFVFWGLFSGTLGSIMTMAWIFSQHKDIVHNANLWFFWPTDFLFFIYGLLILINNKNAYSGRSAGWVYPFLVLHLISYLAGIVLWGIGVIEQDITQSVYWLLPSAALLYTMTAKKIQSERIS